MEQYIHTLIAADSNYTANPAQVEAYFSALLGLPNFRLVSGQRYQQGLRFSKPFARIRTLENRSTGEKMTLRVPEFAKLDALDAIVPSIKSLHDFGVFASGEWDCADLPVALFTIDGEPFKENYLCEVSCQQRAAPVSMSAWDVEAGPNVHNVPAFGSPCSLADDKGVFPNPWTGEAIEVPHAGCAGFWIEFEFGKFIYPKISRNFDVLSPPLLAKAEACFQTKFVQGCRFW
jgi:hypothetical protein